MVSLTVVVPQHGVPDDYRGVWVSVDQLRGTAMAKVAVVQEKSALAEYNRLETTDVESVEHRQRAQTGSTVQPETANLAKL